MNIRTASRAAGFFLVAGLILAGVAPAGADQASEFAKAVFDATNAVRLQYGLYPLAPDARLAGTSLAHSQIMASHALQAHQIPPEAGLGGRLDAAGYRWTTGRENLAQWPITSSAADL